jgi:RHS repeat-associated protein
LNQASGSLPNFKYIGQRADSLSGLYYYNARYYDPATGRFIQPDSIVPQPYNPSAWDRYAYVNNNPINRVDPTGHSVDCGLGDSDCLAGKSSMIAQDIFCKFIQIIPSVIKVQVGRGQWIGGRGVYRPPIHC